MPVSGPDPLWIDPAAPHRGAMLLERCARRRQPRESLARGSRREMRVPPKDSSGLEWRVRVEDNHPGRVSRSPLADPQSLTHKGTFYAAVNKWSQGVWRGPSTYRSHIRIPHQVLISSSSMVQSACGAAFLTKAGMDRSWAAYAILV